MKFKFELEEQVVIKENGAVGLVNNRKIEGEWLYTVSYYFNGEVYCKEFYEDELETYEDEMEKNRKLNVLIAKLEREKYFVVNHNQTFDRLTRVQQKGIAKKLLEMDTAK